MDIGESGDRTEFPFFVSCKKFEGNFTMARCSFGGVSDQFGATSWAAHKTGMVPNLLPCEINMTEWLKDKYKGRVRPGQEEDLVIPKLQVIQNIS